MKLNERSHSGNMLVTFIDQLMVVQWVDLYVLLLVTYIITPLKPKFCRRYVVEPLKIFFPNAQQLSLSVPIRDEEINKLTFLLLQFFAVPQKIL